MRLTAINIKAADGHVKTAHTGQRGGEAERRRAGVGDGYQLRTQTRRRLSDLDSRLRQRPPLERRYVYHSTLLHRHVGPEADEMAAD